MADCAAFLSCPRLQLPRGRFGAISPVARAVPGPAALHRDCSKGRDNATYFSGSLKAAAVDGSLATGFKRNYPHKRPVVRCYCMGTLLNHENLMPINWVPIIDQALLMTSIMFAYMAGAVPRGSGFANAQGSVGARKKTLDDDADASDFTISGRSTVSKNQGNFEDFWDEVKGKLLDALNFSDLYKNLYDSAAESETYNAKRPLSLLALKGGPRLRLLCATVQKLQNEVLSISQVHEADSWNARLVIFSKIIQGSVQLVFLEWLEGELSLQNKGRDKEHIRRTYGTLERDDSILQKIDRMGKKDLYADLIFFLRFGSHSTHYCYSDNMFGQHGVDILEDLVVSLADEISSIYLELISVDSSLSPEMEGLGLSVCSLSTRALQKLRNEVALNQWLVQNFESVVSMYEDRFELYVLKKIPFHKPDVDVSGKLNWWKSFLLERSSSSASSLHYVLVTQLPISVKRVKELKALTGWRYYFSLFLELSDITMPLLKAAFGEARNAISFFLTCLIGRSLGLIYTGIRQSLGWR